MSRLFRITLLFAAVALLPAGVFAERAPEGAIVATTNILADLVGEIAGDDYPVTALMRAGIDPHLYKATQGDVGRLAKARIIFFNGLQLEGKMAQVLTKMNSQKPTVAVAEAVPMEHLRKAQDKTTIYDPHLWFDPLLWKLTIPKIVESLGTVFPGDVDKFQKNGERHTKLLESLHEWTEKTFSSLPEERRVLVTAHDAFGYFGRRYNFEVIGLQGVSTTSEFGLGDLQRITTLVIDRKIPAVFVESSVPKRFVEALIEGTTAKGWKLSLGGELYSDSMGEKGSEGDTYEKMVRHNVGTIAKALSK